MLAESRTTAVCRLAVGAVDRPRETTGTSTFVVSGRRAVATIAGDSTAMPPAMTIVMTWAVMIVIVMMPAMATASVVAAQQHVK